MKMDTPHLDERLDKMLKQAIQPPENLTDSIQLAITTHAKEKIPTFHWWYNRKLLGIAAASVALFVAILAIGVHLSVQPSAPRLVTAEHLHKATSVKAPIPPNDIELETEIPQVFGLVSANSFNTNVSIARAQKCTIEDSVVHTWYVKDLNKSKASLQNFATQNNIAITFETGSNTAKLKLSDRQLQKLVDTMEASHAKLFDQQLPRPHWERRMHFTDKTVTYFCTFIAE